MIHEAILFEKLEKDAIRCHLCAHRCVVRPSRRAICQVRENRDGELYTLVYGRIIAENIDPIEKKPLYHFQPGSRSYSIATCGCNMSCTHCQNYYISLEAPLLDPIPGEDRSPEDIVNAAEKSGCRSISYTYTEPIIFAEFALDCFILAHEKNMANVFVTNGFFTPEAVEAIVPGLDAANIDLKGASEEHYRTVCKGRLEPVLESIDAMHKAGVWIEITTLLIPGLNDGLHLDRSIADLAGLYNAAVLLVTPSFYEGFGLPALEAMQCGTPVVVGNRASLPEVVGEAGLLVDPEDPAEIAEALRRRLD
jgi:pyruvate formate lyase activating enzyme